MPFRTEKIARSRAVAADEFHGRHRTLAGRLKFENFDSIAGCSGEKQVPLASRIVPDEVAAPVGTVADTVATRSMFSRIGSTPTGARRCRRAARGVARGPGF